jgi:hypothetical protein
MVTTIGVIPGPGSAIAFDLANRVNWLENRTDAELKAIAVG